jgi:hypothetical protein
MFALGAALALGTVVAIAPRTAWTLSSPWATGSNPDDLVVLTKTQTNQHPFGKAVSCTGQSVGCIASIIVPMSQHWAVESVSYLCGMPLGARLDSFIIGTTITNELVGVFPALDRGVDAPSRGRAEAQSGENLRFYADPGTKISLTLTFSAPVTSDNAACNFTIEGQAIDVPQNHAHGA